MSLFSGNIRRLWSKSLHGFPNRSFLFSIEGGAIGRGVKVGATSVKVIHNYLEEVRL